jgi:signal transduction histidine kinase
MFERLQLLHDQSYEILIKLRRLARDLRPPVLDALGLKVAMQTYCTEFTRRTYLPVIFEADSSLPQFPDIYNITLYRVLQEALTNIVKHAQASQVWVDLSIEDDLVNLTIQDNGIGFNDANLPSNGIGLTGLHERITIAGGTLNINSTPRHGTILSAQFPLSDHIRTKEAK